MRPKLVVGLTGGIGSGKTTVADLFAIKGVTIIDADLITRQLTEPNQPALTAITEHFGKGILTIDGKLNRNQLRKIIFKNPAARKWLEDLLHPLVRTEMALQAAKTQSPYCIAVIPLLLETEKNPMISRVLVIDTPEAIQLQRVLGRDKASEEEIHAIIKSQIPRDERLAKADDVIDNWGDRVDLIPQVDRLHLLYLSLAGM